MPTPAGELLFATSSDAAQQVQTGCLPQHCTLAFLKRESAHE
jgi:hypothetical protein